MVNEVMFDGYTTYTDTYTCDIIVENRIELLHTDSGDMIENDEKNTQWAFCGIDEIYESELIEFIFSLKGNLEKYTSKIDDNYEILDYSTCIQLILAKQLLFVILSNTSGWFDNGVIREQMTIHILSIIDMLTILQEVQYWRVYDLNISHDAKRVYCLDYVG